MIPRAALVLLVGMLAGCAKVGAGAGSSPGEHSWTQPHVLRIADVAEPDTLNTVVGNEQVDVDLAMFWGGFLFNYNDRGEFVPELATEYPTTANGGISPDGRTITYHLRRGVKWQDGAPFTADDVLFTYRAIMNPLNNTPSRTGYDTVDRIAKRDDFTVVVHLKHVWAPFTASFLTLSGTAYAVLPAHLLAKYPDINRLPYNSKPVGTGPFIVEKWDRGSEIRMRANPGYWRGAPKLRAVIYKPIPDSNTILTQLRTHEVDMDYNAAVAQVDELRKIDGIVVDPVPFVAYAQFVFNLKNPVLADQRVREALVLALDRRAIVDKVTHGVHILGEGDQPPFMWSANPNIVATPYAPAKARLLFDQAGWSVDGDGIRVKDGKRLALTLAISNGSATQNATAVLAQRFWKDAGVEVTVKGYASSVFFATAGAGGILQTGKFDIGTLAWYNGVDPDNSTLFMCDQAPPAGQNTASYCNPALDRLERTALSTNDRAARAQAYRAIGAILAHDKPFVNLYFVRRLNVYSSDLKNYKPAHAATPFWNPWELDI